VKGLRIYLMTMLAVLLACGSVAAELEDRIVAVVNNEIITMRELNRSFEPYAKSIQMTHKGSDLEGVLEHNKKVFLQRMIDQILIEHEAKKGGKNFTTIKDEEVMAVIMDMLTKNNMSMDAYLKKLASEGKTLQAVKKDISEQMLRMRVLRSEVQSKIVVTDEEIGDYYDKHRSEYEGKEAVRIRQIFLPAPAGQGKKTRETVRGQARQLHERILKGESFEMLASQYSKEPAAAQGGDIGFVERGAIMPNVEKVAFEMPVGQVSDVIETESGFHIVMVVDKRGEGLKSMSEVRNEIRAKIENEKATKKYDEWIDGVRKKSFIDVRF